MPVKYDVIFMAKQAPLGQRALVEGLGTFILLFVSAGSLIIATHFFPGSAQLLTVALATGLALALGVSVAMNISGGHINPAVTIAMYSVKRISGGDAIVYIIAQAIGAIVGTAVLMLMPPTALYGSMLGLLTLNPSIGVLQAIAIEAIITFILVIVIFGTVVDGRAPKIGGLGIGLALAILILVAGPLTGGAANPIRALGPEIVTLNFNNWYVYWIGDIIGAVVAALVYTYGVLKK